MSLAVDTVDRMIQDTLEATRDVPVIPRKYGTEMGVDFRLAVLKEVKSALIGVEVAQVEQRNRELLLEQQKVDSSRTVEVPDMRCICHDRQRNASCPRHGVW